MLKKVRTSSVAVFSMIVLCAYSTEAEERLMYSSLIASSQYDSKDESTQ